jgi:hypothetical protein
MIATFAPFASHSFAIAAGEGSTLFGSPHADHSRFETN